jgi:hypothetical protein
MRSGTFLRLLVPAALAAGLLLLGPAEAALPGSGTINSGSPSTSWMGQFYAVASVADPAECPPPAPDTVCDHFYLDVTELGGAQVTINWSSSDNDFDLYVYDSGGNQVASSASGGTTSEQAFIPNALGTYEVRVVPFLVIGSGYNGQAQWVSTPAPTPNPSRTTGGLTFGPATVIDAQRTEGEPVNHIDKFGNYWESGPWGFSTGQSFVHKSVDNGDQFNIDSPNGIRPDPPPGGGDSDITTDDQGFAYFADLEGALEELGVAVSNDGGNNWRKNPAAVASSGDDRQWLAVDNGPTGTASDNTVFLSYDAVAQGIFVYSTPGSTGSSDLIGGIVYTNAIAGNAPVHSSTTCGQSHFDPVHRKLYLPCDGGDHVDMVVVNVPAGQRTGLTFTSYAVPQTAGGGDVANLFPVVATDRAGNVYAVWANSKDNNVYYSASTNQGQTWGQVFHVNGNDANSNVMPWATAGNAGNLVVVWYGNTSHLNSNDMPSWYNDRDAASAFPWFGYVSEITTAAGSSPSFIQTRFTEKPMHYGQICTGGIGCTVSGGDRTMADFFAVNVDRSGAIRTVYNDTTSQHHGAHLFEERQLAGPSPLGTTLHGTAPTNPVNDPTGDAQSPHYAPTGTGPNLPQFDFTRLRLSQPNANTLRVQMTLNSLSTLTPPTGKSNSLWLTRFQALSIGDQGEEAYRIFYVGAESIGGASPTFFAGSGMSDQGGVKNNGCFTTTTENCKIVQYPAESAATGSISGNVITIDVPIQGGFGLDRPVDGSVLYNVTALSAGREASSPTAPATADLYADLDATRSFDFPLTGVSPPPPGSCREVKGEGSLQGRGLEEAYFSLHTKCENRIKGKIEYKDHGAVPAVDFHSRLIRSVIVNDTSHTARISGSGVNSGHMVDFTVDVTAGRDSTATFSIILSDGYSNSGPLIHGKVEIR